MLESDVSPSVAEVDMGNNNIVLKGN